MCLRERDRQTEKRAFRSLANIRAKKLSNKFTKNSSGAIVGDDGNLDLNSFSYHISPRHYIKPYLSAQVAELNSLIKIRVLKVVNLILARCKRADVYAGSLSRRIEIKYGPVKTV